MNKTWIKLSNITSSLNISIWVLPINEDSESFEPTQLTAWVLTDRPSVAEITSLSSSGSSLFSNCHGRNGASQVK